MRLNLDSPTLHALANIFDVLVATVLFLLCCLPVFTIGASLSAMYAVLIAIAGNGCTSVIRSFFNAFRENFKQATILWLPAALVGLVVAVDITVCWGFEMEQTMILAVMRGLTIFCTALYLAVTTYVFSGIAVYRVTWKQAISNALIFSTKKLPETLGILGLWAAMAAAALVFWYFAFPFVALCMYLQSKLLRRVFDLNEHMKVPHWEEEINY